MNGMMKQVFVRFVLPVLVPVVVGLGSSVISTHVMLSKLDMRVGNVEALKPRVEKLEKLESRIPPLESQITRHEKALERDFARHEQTVSIISHKTDDQEKRLTRLETLVGETQALLTEIRSDVKILLRGGQQ